MPGKLILPPWLRCERESKGAIVRLVYVITLANRTPLALLSIKQANLAVTVVDKPRQPRIPRRAAATLSRMAEVFGADRPAALCRELTKDYEEVRRGHHRRRRIPTLGARAGPRRRGPRARGGRYAPQRRCRRGRSRHGRAQERPLQGGTRREVTRPGNLRRGRRPPSSSTREPALPAARRRGRSAHAARASGTRRGQRPRPCRPRSATRRGPRHPHP